MHCNTIMLLIKFLIPNCKKFLSRKLYILMQNSSNIKWMELMTETYNQKSEM